MRARHWCSWLVVWPLTCLATERAAESADRPRSLVSLEWTRGPGAEACLSESELIDDVEFALKRHAFTERSRADRVLRAQIQRFDASPRWRAQITLSTARNRNLGDREITVDSESCDEASESLVFALALMIDLPPTPEELDERRRQSVPPAPWHLSGGLAPSAAVDSSPSAWSGAHGTVVLTPGRLWPVLADTFFWVQSRSGPDQQSFVLARGIFALGVCPVAIHGARSGLAVCAGPQAELVTGWGTGFAKDQGGLGFTIGGLAQSRITYSFGDRVHAFATFGIAATPQRVEFTFLDERKVERLLHRTSFVSGLGSFGIALDFL